MIELLLWNIMCILSLYQWVILYFSIISSYQYYILERTNGFTTISMSLLNCLSKLNLMSSLCWNISWFFLCEYRLSQFVWLDHSIAGGNNIAFRWFPEPSCSKLTTSLVNDSLKFKSSDMQICWNFLLKNVSSFCSAKATHIFSAKNIRILYIESAKIVNERTLNELVKLTTLWTTGPSMLTHHHSWPVSSCYLFI